MADYRTFIFVHIPKCAGTSFRELIHRNGIASGIPEEKMHIPGFGGLDNDKNISQLSKSEIIDLRKKNLIVLADHSKYDINREAKLGMGNPFYFILFRDPVARFISHYNFFQRQLGRDNMLGRSLNDLSEPELEDLLYRWSNTQLSFLLNAPAFAVKHLPPHKKYFKRPVKMLLRYISGGRLFAIKQRKSVAFDAEPFWLDCAEDLLINAYGGFGIVERMEASLQFLAKSDTGLMKFNDLNMKFANMSKLEASNEEIDQRIIDKFIDFNQFDIQLYERVVKLFDAKSLIQS
ncbi:MAG: Sulfotransferase family [Bacteroidota bacterium]|jgi:hypothetical protein